MKILARSLWAVSLLGIPVVAAMAQTPVGSWKGKLAFDRSEVIAALTAVSAADPKASGREQSAEDRKKVEALADSLISQLEKAGFALTLKEGNAWTMVTKGMPGKKDTVTEGTWAQDGKKLTLTPTKEDGKPVVKPKSGRLAEPMVFTFVDARTLTCTQDQFGMKIAMVFGRA